MSTNKKYFILSSYSFSHMVVDFVCATLVLSFGSLWIVDTTTLIDYIILYNILAFGLQTPIGYFADNFKISKSLSLISCVLLAISLIIFYLNFSLTCVIIIWIANACFHIWWWITTLTLEPWRARIPWIFVAPWALWLFLWILYWKSWNLFWWECLALLITAFTTMLFSSLQFNPYEIAKNFYKEEIKKKITFKIPAILITGLLFISIIIRSMIWFLIQYSWKSEILFWLFFILCIVTGKFFWGILADKYGWKKIWVGSLILSLLCLLLGENYFIFWMIWIFLFNITMPIAFMWMIKSYPWRRWLMFWLLCLALLIWALPMLFNIQFNNRTIVVVYLILLSSILLYIALDSLRIKK